MTMPHLMNCPHSEEGWCLSCVKELWEQGATIELGRQLIVRLYDTDISVGEVVDIVPISMGRPVIKEPSLSSDETSRYVYGDTMRTEFKISCVLREGNKLPPVNIQNDRED